MHQVTILGSYSWTDGVWSHSSGVTVFFTCRLVFTAPLLTVHLSVTLYMCVCVCAHIMKNNLSIHFFLSLRQSAVPQSTFSMPVSVPVSNQNAAALQFSNNPGGTLVTSTLTDPRLLSPQQPGLQRNTVSPGLPQRPASAGRSRG